MSGIKPMKTEDGVEFPKEAYAYTPSDKPSEWKIRLWETPEKKETPRQIGMAAAALGEGFRGNKAQIPTRARAAVIAKVRAAWKQANPDKSEDEMPDVLKRKAKMEAFDDDEAAENTYSFREITEELQDALGDLYGNALAQVIDVYDDYFVFKRPDFSSYPGDDTYFRCDYTLNADGDVTIGMPEVVEPHVTYEPEDDAQPVAMAAFSLNGTTPAPRGDFITRTGKIFELGDYPDKHFSLTEAEADQAIAQFKPCPLALEHFEHEGKSHMFAGELGTLDSVWRKGKDIYGKVTVPTWPDGIWAKYGRKVSTLWDVATKTLNGCGLVLNPRVESAALMSAYAAFAGSRHNKSDQKALDDAHEMLVKAGANCPGNKASYTKPPVKQPGKAGPVGLKGWSMFSKLFQGKVKLTPVTTGADGTLTEGEPVLAEFGQEQAQEPGVQAQSAQAAEAPEVAALKAEIAQLKEADKARAQREAAFAAERRKGEAVAFTNAAYEASKLLPKQAFSAQELYLQLAALDEARSSQVMFSDGKQGTLVSLLKDIIDGYEPHNLMRPLVAAQFQAGQSGQTQKESIDQEAQAVVAAWLKQVQPKRNTGKGGG